MENKEFDFDPGKAQETKPDRDQEDFEAIKPKTVTVTGNEFIQLIFRGGSELEDRRFFPDAEGGAFKYLDLDDLLRERRSEREKRYYPLVKLEELIVGFAELQENPFAENTYWLKAVSVDGHYQGKGYASKLIEEIFRFAKEKGFIIESSSYSPMGLVKLKKVLNRMAQETGVKFIDSDRVLPVLRSEETD